MNEISPGTGSSSGNLLALKSELNGEFVRPWIACLTSSDASLNTADGATIEVLQFTAPTDADVLCAWARSFRQRYCLDDEIDELRDGTGLSRSEYLLAYAFPDASVKPGPSIRAGDFAELLVSDYVEHTLGYWVPQGKYAEKAVRNESVKGVDILGFKISDLATPQLTDALLAFEVKAQLSGAKYVDRLQVAVNDSSKDYLRRAESLNATKRRLLRAKEPEKARIVRRFQMLSDHPYQYRSGAAAMLSDASFDLQGLSSTITTHHQNASNLQLLVIKGVDLMALASSLYARAANEA